MKHRNTLPGLLEELVEQVEDVRVPVIHIHITWDTGGTGPADERCEFL